MKIFNPSNAFLRIEVLDYVVICDPWITDGLYDGSWAVFPPMQNGKEYLKGATHLFISHIHQDHCDPKALDLLNRNLTAVIPDIYPNHLIKIQLEKMGFQNIVMLPVSQPTEISKGLTLEVIGPMNEFGQEFEQYALDTDTIVAIDAGLILTAENSKAVLLSDNTPYFCEKIGQTFERMKRCDLLAFPFNGAASDYPICYENLSLEEKTKIANLREDTRTVAMDEFIQQIQPKAMMPYSSDFAVMGPKAKEFAAISNEWWGDRTLVAKRYAESHRLPCYDVRCGDFLEINGARQKFVSAGHSIPLLENEASRFFSSEPPFRKFYPEIDDLSQLENLIESAGEHMFEAMDRYNIKSQWTLSVVCKSSKGEMTGLKPFYIHLGNRTISREKQTDEFLLTCELEDRHLNALLSGKCHWDNAQLSFQLRWRRAPNVYDHGLYAAMNFFHVSRILVK